MVTLDQLRPGQSGRVVRVDASPAMAQRLAEMGLLEGTTLKLVRTAPLGDPLEIELEGWFLSIRKADARGVHLDEPFGGS
jgi:ferrous iron transport protein A